MSYRLEELGPHEFEKMVQALLLRVYGPTVTVFGSGKDDGRDATYTGHAVPVEPDGSGWSGYHVFQSKFQEHPTGPKTSKTWLRSQVQHELNSWTERDSDGKHKRQGQRPQYYVVVTNAPLSGQIGGGVDEIKQLIRDHASQPEHRWQLKDCDVWHRAKIEQLLTAYADVRQAFNGLITAGDVLAALKAGTMTVTPVEETVTILEEHARGDLVHHGKVVLGEAGDVGNQRLDLAGVAVDLSAHLTDDQDPDSSVQVLSHIITTANRVLRPSIAREGTSPHFLLLGGPGQGKTTLGRILIQTYRAALLTDRPNLSPAVTGVVAATSERSDQIGLPPVVVRRWPFRVDLAEYADLIGGGADVPLIKYIADQINKPTGAEFRAADTRKWLTAWPWLLVLDGYDEVAAPTARENVAHAVTSLLETAHTVDADLMVIATTRPQGYGDELPPALRELRLLNLTPSEAVHYATTLTDLRMGNDPTKTEVLDRIRAAVDNDLTSRLMRTPLQVMIMSLLLEKRSKPPQDRAGLFAAYYDVIYEREVAKKNYLAQVLANYRPDIDAIHHRVGLTLQARSEGQGDAEALMLATELQQIIRQQLVDQGHEGKDLERLVTSLSKAARDRLVLLAAKGKDHVEFDLRSLQEYMAARALTSGSEEQVLASLRALAPSSHWRNTWLLAVGTLYHRSPYLFDRVLQVMRDIDADDPLSLIVATGPRLAIDILDDGVAMHTPKHIRLLTAHALEALNGVSIGAARLGEVLADQVLNDTTRTEVVRALERALTDTPSSWRSARWVLEALSAPNQTGPLAAKARQLWPPPYTFGAAPNALPQGKLVTLAHALPETTAAWEKGTPHYQFRRDLLRINTTTDEYGAFDRPDPVRLPPSGGAVLADPEALMSVVAAIDEIAPHNWSAKSSITVILWLARQHLPVAHAIEPILVRPAP